MCLLTFSFESIKAKLKFSFLCPIYSLKQASKPHRPRKTRILIDPWSFNWDEGVNGKNLLTNCWILLSNCLVSACVADGEFDIYHIRGLIPCMSCHRRGEIKWFWNWCGKRMHQRVSCSSSKLSCNNFGC